MQDFCKSEEIALKSFFLGPQAENANFLKQEIFNIIESWVNWRKNKFPDDGIAITEEDQRNQEFQNNLATFHSNVQKLSARFYQEIPKFSPRYIGHMFSDISLPALLGHIITLLHNPNNISKESSLVGVEIEKEAIRSLSRMFGYPENSSGHFTSGGTIANYESIIRAKRRWLNNLESHWENALSFNESCYLKIKTKNSTNFQFNNYSDIKIGKLINEKFNFDFTGPAILVPQSKHYSWLKAASLFGIGKENIIEVELNKYGQMDIALLAKTLEKCLVDKKPILSIVSVCGTTELGTIDPIHQIQELLDSYKTDYGYSIWHHIDAAYGGFFATLKDSKDVELNSEVLQSLKFIAQSTSITIDPHKLGYVPYSSGAFICRDDADYFNHEISAPYVDFKNHVDRGPYTIEGSRSAAGAVATSLTADCIGFNEKGYGSILLRTIKTRDRFINSLKESQVPALFIDTVGTNILCFSIGKKNSLLSEVNKNTQKIIHKFNTLDKNLFFISKTTLGKNFNKLISDFCQKNEITQDADELLVVRLTIMNPFISSVHPKINFIQEFTKTIAGMLEG